MNTLVTFCVGVSIFGLVIMLVLGLNPVVVQDDQSFRKFILGFSYGVICILGIFATIYPKSCAGALHFSRKRENHSSTIASSALVGHHINCGEFSSHVLQIGNHSLCAACIGLFMGAVIAILGTILYVSNGIRITGLCIPILVVGSICVILGFLQLGFSGLVRLLLNTFFVLGTFLILISIDETLQSLYVGIFLILTIIFWLFTRITLSKWDHMKTCRNCRLKCPYIN
ncbi:MAG: hypothetical protein PVF96_00955 [Candidatus Bathyarchaeota archaeon]